MSEKKITRFTKSQERFGKRLLKFTSMAHRFLYRLTGGAIGGTAVGLPVALLTTIGRKSGQPRVTPVVYSAGDNGEVYMVGSLTGMSTHPQWYYNMKATPEVDVQLGRKKLKMVARQATPEERPSVWERFSKNYSGFDDYEKRTEGIREIPVMILEPAQASPPTS